MNPKDNLKSKAPGLMSMYHQFWVSLQSYAKKYRKAFYSMYTL